MILPVWTTFGRELSREREREMKGYWFPFVFQRYTYNGSLSLKYGED
jgi:hypothetical protein